MCSPEVYSERSGCSGDGARRGPRGCPPRSPPVHLTSMTSASGEDTSMDVRRRRRRAAPHRHADPRRRLDRRHEGRVHGGGAATGLLRILAATINHRLAPDGEIRRSRRIASARLVPARERYAVITSIRSHRGDGYSAGGHLASWAWRGRRLYKTGLRLGQVAAPRAVIANWARSRPRGQDGLITKVFLRRGPGRGAGQVRARLRR